MGKTGMFRKAAVFLTHSYCRDLHNTLARVLCLFLQKHVFFSFTVNNVFPRSSEKTGARNALRTDIPLNRLLLFPCN